MRAYRRIETLVNVIAFVLATYLAGASVLRAAKWPNEHAWQPWTGWFIALLFSAVVVPLFALLKYFDAKQAEKTVQESQLDADMARLCQEMAAALARVCQGLSLDTVAVQIWLCDEASGKFDRRWRFFLPFDRPASGIVWRKGLGIAGTAWAQGRDLAVSIKKLKELPRAQFEGLPDGEGYGMTYAQTQSSAYTGIIAVRLYNQEAGDALLGMLVIDYTGDGQWDCLSEAMTKPEVYKIAGACARRLSAAKFLRSDYA